ncbi:MAG: helix-turn-helix transcriptional regulator [Oscillospiraceae bacterium]|nr:helix-turn-helix transcriptional regulator [Oscillospiraceae bacterium]
MNDNPNNPFSPYELQFSVQERKAMVAEMLRELRKAKGYQQKEIAELLGISPQTYNGYETGRNEPPIEVLVRFSYLYELPIDMLVQKDRQHKENESVMVTVTKMDEEIAAIKKQFKNSKYAENIQLNQMMDMLQQLTDMMKSVATNAASNDK